MGQRSYTPPAPRKSRFARAWKSEAPPAASRINAAAASMAQLRRRLERGPAACSLTQSRLAAGFTPVKCSRKTADETEETTMRCVILGLVSVFLFSGLVWGQATAQISGAIRDETGAVIPGTEVKVTKTATGATRTAVSNE